MTSIIPHLAADLEDRNNHRNVADNHDSVKLCDAVELSPTSKPAPDNLLLLNVANNEDNTVQESNQEDPKTSSDSSSFDGEELGQGPSSTLPKESQAKEVRVTKAKEQSCSSLPTNVFSRPDSPYGCMSNSYI